MVETKRELAGTDFILQRKLAIEIECLCSKALGRRLMPSVEVRWVFKRYNLIPSMLSPPLSLSRALCLLLHAPQEGFETTVRQWVFPEKISHNGKEACLPDVINEVHENVKYLPGVKLPENVVACGDLKEASRGATVLVFVLPHQVTMIHGDGRWGVGDTDDLACCSHKVH